MGIESIFGVRIRQRGESRSYAPPPVPIAPQYEIPPVQNPRNYYNPMWPMRMGDNSAKGFYRKFHYRNPKSARMVETPDTPKESFVIGRLYSLTYLPYGNSGKPHELHVHRFGDYGYKHDYNTLHLPLLTGDSFHNLHIPRDKSKFFLDGRGIVG